MVAAEAQTLIAMITPPTLQLIVADGLMITTLQILTLLINKTLVEAETAVVQPGSLQTRAVKTTVEAVTLIGTQAPVAVGTQVVAAVVVAEVQAVAEAVVQQVALDKLCITV